MRLSKESTLIINRKRPQLYLIIKTVEYKKSETVTNDDDFGFTLFWWAIRDSNPGPTGYEPVALTN